MQTYQLLYPNRPIIIQTDLQYYNPNRPITTQTGQL
jgi:hypothetical protein